MIDTPQVRRTTAHYTACIRLKVTLEEMMRAFGPAVEDVAKFYAWYEGNVKSGRFKPGSRLSTDVARVSESGIVTDGPFGEAKEIIGGYWIILAGNLREAAELAAQNPCVQHGLHFEICPLDSSRASAYITTTETPSTTK